MSSNRLRLVLCISVSLALHAALLVSGWQQRPLPVDAAGHALPVTLMNAAATESGIAADRGRREAATQANQPPPVAPERTAPRAQDPLPGTAATDSLTAKPGQKVVSRSRAAETADAAEAVRPRQANRPFPEPVAKTATEAKTERATTPQPTPESAAEPDRGSAVGPVATRSGPETVFQCIDLLCAARTGQPESAETRNDHGRETGSVPPSVANVGQPPPSNSGPVPTDADFIDARPRYRSNPLPEYPYLARQRHWQGEVWLMVTVSAAGRVEELEVAESSGYGVLDKAALKSVRRWRFFPAEKAGLRVASQVRVPVRFKLRD
ncbi:MAG TPA: energy transducer TonB [Desulfuromonadales bacterium]|nr:energy transducer TonB [Desulfuromonadales bacterium]